MGRLQCKTAAYSDYTPRPPQAFVGPDALYGFFRGWVWKQGADPDILLQGESACADWLRKEAVQGSAAAIT
jgi:hypothetical protein